MSFSTTAPASICSNACSAQAPVLNGVFNTTWSINRPHRLSVEHDAANERFVYAVRPLIGPEETLELSYAGLLSDGTPPVVSFRQLAINNSAANCTSGQRRGAMDALFETFQVLRP